MSRKKRLRLIVEYGLYGLWLALQWIGIVYLIIRYA